MMAQNGVSITGYTLSGKLPWERQADRLPGPQTFGMFKALNGYVYVAADPQMHQKLMAAMGVDDLGEGTEVLDGWVGNRTVEEVVEVLKDACPVAPVQNIDKAVEDPQVRHRGTMIEVEHSKAGKVRMPGFPLKMEKTPGVIRMPAPILGEHTAQVLKELLGYSDKKIEELRKSGTIVLA
jgi:CoA:oxalate CoA-transferase